MMIRKIQMGALMAGLAMVSWACVEEAPRDVELEAPGPQAELSQASVVTPEFRISGLDGLPESLVVDRLGLSISAIRLEPLDPSSGLVYSTSEPIDLVFELDRGGTSVERPSVVVPETGRFLVSVRLEPQEAPNSEVARYARLAQEPSSLSIEGWVRSTPASGRMVDTDDDSDGNPVPMPFDKLSIRQDSSTWTPFRYASQSVIYFTFDEVEFVDGEQFLTFDFDLSEWSAQVLEPLVSSVEIAMVERELEERVEISDLTFDLSTETDLQAPETFLASGTVTTSPADLPDL